jgi:hypothetical protein
MEIEDQTLVYAKKGNVSVVVGRRSCSDGPGSFRGVVRTIDLCGRRRPDNAPSSFLSLLFGRFALCVKLLLEVLRGRQRVDIGPEFDNLS